MSSAPTEPTANLTDAARRLLEARQNFAQSTPSNNANNPFLNQDPTVSAITEDATSNPMDPPALQRELENTLTQARDDKLDLRTNDNGYHVIATIVADKLEYQKMAPDTSEAEADEAMTSLLPIPVQEAFAEATKYRLQKMQEEGRLDLLTNPVAPGSIEDLLLKCANFTPVKRTEAAPVIAPPKDPFMPTPAPPEAPFMPTPATGHYQPPRSLQDSKTPVKPDNPKKDYLTEAQSANIRSKARQQIMSEIEESKRLMDSATTEEASQFWKKHLDVLYASLNRLTNDDKVEPAPEKPPSPKRLGPPSTVGGMPAKKVWVIAPANLPGGYRFEAQLENRKFLATVPPGGVVKGQTFLTEYRDLDRVVMSVPVGHWRDNIYDCFSQGICHPMFLTTIFCPLISLGQIMTRTRMTWTGTPGPIVETRMTFTSMWIILFSYITLNLVFIALPLTRDSPFRDAETGDVDWLDAGPVLAVNLAFVLYCWCVTARTRASIKDKYAIEDTCGPLEDCLCAGFCQPCTICQMGRHTADYDTFRASCCTATGLPRKVECPDGPNETLSMYNQQNVRNLV
mmetsp:Transcript_20975/g.27062  ORF Transcript_20975/g.27062 Transcript_20975/m.27062 type:complete len:569 (+) Transcript_20975:151-1857(+)